MIRGYWQVVMFVGFLLLLAGCGIPQHQPTTEDPVRPAPAIAELRPSATGHVIPSPIVCISRQGPYDTDHCVIYMDVRTKCQYLAINHGVTPRLHRRSPGAPLEAVCG